MAWWIEAGRCVAAGSRRSNAASVSAWPCSRVWLSMRLSITRVLAESFTTQHEETHCHPEQARLLACDEADARRKTPIVQRWPPVGAFCGQESPSPVSY